MTCKIIPTSLAMAIACSRQPKKPCSYCERPGQYLCDFELSSGKTCDAPMCKLHTFAAAPGKDHCRIHARQVKAADAPPVEKEKRATIVFLARSKFGGRCKVRGCQNRWEAGDPIFWDTEIKEAYCEDCGSSLSPY